MDNKMFAVLACVILCFFSSVLSKPGLTDASARTNTAWFFVEIETKLYRKGVEISSENPSERRWYISNVVVQPEDVPTYSLVKQKIMPYFSRNVMDPVESRGISLDYGGQDVRLCGETSQANYLSKAEAEEVRSKAIEYRKNQSGNIYSFELFFGPAKGEETSKPKLIYRDKEQPNY